MHSSALLCTSTNLAHGDDDIMAAYCHAIANIEQELHIVTVQHLHANSCMQLHVQRTTWQACLVKFETYMARNE